MFKKLKDKIEEVRQTPSRLPVQSLAQERKQIQQTDLHYSPFSYSKQPEVEVPPNIKENVQSQLLIDLNDNGSPMSTQAQQFTLVEDEVSNTDVTSPIKSIGNFQTVDLSEASAASTPNASRTRTSSESSFQGEMSVPSYTPPSYLFNPQSDMESASEFEDTSPNLDQIPKSRIFEAFKKTRLRYQKYRGKYAELVKAYKEIESEKEKIKTKLSESQDKSLRRIAELREEALLDKQAKNDMEATYRIMLDEKDEKITVLHTQVRLLKDGVPNDAIKSSENNSNDSVINSFTNAAAGDSVSQVEGATDYDTLLEKNKRLENILVKCKENMKISKERFSQVMKEKNDLQIRLDDVQQQLVKRNVISNDNANSEEITNANEEDVQKNEELYLLNVKIDEITREKDKLQKIIDENCRELEAKHDMQVRIDELIAARAHLEEKLQLTEKFIEENENLKRSLEEMESQWTTKCNEFCEKAEANSQLLLSKQKEYDELKTKLDELSTDDKNYKKTVDEFEVKLNELNTEKRNLEQQIYGFEENLKQNFNGLIMLKDSLKKHEVIGTKVDENFVLDDSGSIENICNGFTRIIHIFQSEMETLQYKFRRAADYAEEQNIKLETNEKVNEKLQQEREEYENEIRDFQHQVNVFENERETLLENIALNKQQVTNATLELQKQQFFYNNLVRENDELHTTVEDFRSQINLLNDQLSEKDQEMSQVVTEKVAIEESLRAQLHDLRNQQGNESNAEESESLSILLQNFEKEVGNKDTKLKQVLDDLEMEKVMRQSSTESEQNWIRKFEDSDAMASQLQIIIANLEKEKQKSQSLLIEKSEEFEATRIGYEEQLKEANDRMAREMKSFQEGEKRLQEELQILQTQQNEDKTSIIDVMQKLHECKYELEESLNEKNKELEHYHEMSNDFLEIKKLISSDDVNSQSLSKAIKEKLDELNTTVEILSRDKEELQQKMENLVQVKDDDIQSMKISQVEKLTDLKNKTSEGIGHLKEKINELKSELEKQREEFDKCKMEIQLTSNKQIEELQKRLTEEKIDLEKKYETVENDLQQKENLVESFKSELKQSRDVEFELNNFIETERQKYKDSISRVKNECQQEIESYEEQMKLLQAEKEELLAKFTESCEGRDHLKERIRVLQLELNEKGSLDADRESLIQKAMEAEKILWNLRNEYDNCKKLLEKTEVEFNELQLSGDAKIRDISAQIESKDNQIEHLQKNCTELSEKWGNEKQLLEQRYEDLRENYSNGISDLEERLNQSLATQKSVVDEKCMVESVLEENRIQFEKEKDCLLKEIEDIKQINEAKWEQREKDFNQELQTKMLELKKKAESKLSQIKKQLQMNKDVAADEIKAEVIQLQETISNLTSSHRTELESFQSRADAILSDIKIEFEEKIKSLEEQLHLARDVTAAEMNAEITQLQETISNLLSSHQTEMENVQSRSDTVLNDTKTELEDKIKDLETQVKLARDEATKKMEEVNQLQERISNLASSHFIEVENLQSNISALNATKVELEEKIKGLEVELETVKKSSLEDSGKGEIEASEGVEKLKETIFELEEKIRLLNEEKEIEVEKCTELENKIVLEKEALQQAINTKNAQIDESLLLSQENASEKEKLLEKNKLEMKKLVLQLKKREEEVVELKKKSGSAKNGEPNVKLDEVKKAYEENLTAKDDEQAKKIKQLVIDFNVQLRNKEQEHEEIMFATIEKLRNEKAKIEKDYQDQMKEMLVDLREKEAYLENLITTTKEENQEKDRILETKSTEYERRLAALEIEHSQKLIEIENKSKSVLHRRLKENAQRYDEEIRGLTNEWNEERKCSTSESGELQAEKLEKQSLLTMAVIESNSGSNQLLRREVMTQSKEMASITTQHQNEIQRLKMEINNLQRLLETTSRAKGPLLTEPTQMEYLRNILFEYMMGRQTTTLAKVIAAVVKFTEFQTQKILEKEESRHNVLTNLLQN